MWEPNREYAFTFNPEPGFKVVFCFDLADGVVQIATGYYVLMSKVQRPPFNSEPSTRSIDGSRPCSASRCGSCCADSRGTC